MNVSGKIFLGVFYGLIIFFLLDVPNTHAQITDQTPPTERLLVKFHPFTSKFQQDEIIALAGATGKRKLKLTGAFVLEFPKGNLAEKQQKINKNPYVEFSEVDGIATTLEIPNDPQFSSQWGLIKIQAPQAWDTSHGASNVKIAVVDTGISYNHPDLTSKIIKSVNCTQTGCPNQQTTDPYGHGTHVAGIASAVTNNSEGISGLAWEGSLMSIKVLGDNGSGYYSWITDGIIYAADNGANVINLSLGGTLSSLTLESAINYAWSKGAIVVAASGNSGRNQRIYPAYYTNSIAVAATDFNDTKASFSNYGSWVDVAAPGVSIVSTYKNSSYAQLSGTSMATPYVTGLAALIIGQNPGWGNQMVRSQIQTSADQIPGTGTYWTWGRINVCEALGCSSNSITQTPVSSSSPIPTTTPFVSPTPTFTASPSLIPTPTSTLIPTEVPTPTPTPIASSTPMPWWCKYIPTHETCK